MTGPSSDSSEAATAKATALAEDRRVLRYIVDNIPYCIFWKDRNSVYLGCNKNFAALDGRADPSELVGKTDYDTVWAAHADEYRRFDRETMQRGEPILAKEEKSLDGQGNELVILTSKVPLKDEAGEVIGLLGMFVDITDRKRIEVQLAQARDAAESAARVKSEFMANVSHELRTPLTLVLGPIDALLAEEAGKLSSSALGQLQRARRNCVRLSSLVDDLLDFSKLEAKRTEVSLEATDVQELVATLVEDAEPLARSRLLALHYDSELGHERVPLDRRMFEKIVLNLLGNALKFTEPGGRIELRLRPDGARFELSVQDTGIGIPKDRQHLLFQRFQQLDASSTRKYAGTGLGLALVKEFSELLGGEVSFESEPGRGSLFRVRLPRSSVGVLPEARPAKRSTAVAQRWGDAEQWDPPAAVQEPHTRLGHVLLVDDNVELREHVRELLGTEYDVTAVENGRYALEAAQQRTPDVIVSDVMMPEMDGFALVAALKQHPTLRHVPVILLTARAGREELVAGLECGADDYLCKPFSPLELRARVRAALRLYRAHREIAVMADELAKSRELVVQAERLSLAGQLADAMAEVELPPESPIERVALADVLGSAIRDSELRVGVAIQEADLSASIAPNDLRHAIQRVLAYLSRGNEGRQNLWLKAVRAAGGGASLIIEREGWSPPASAEEIFRPRLWRSTLSNQGRVELDVDLAVARALLLRNEGELRLERDSRGGVFRLELHA